MELWGYWWGEEDISSLREKDCREREREREKFRDTGQMRGPESPVSCDSETYWNVGPEYEVKDWFMCV